MAIHRVQRLMCRRLGVAALLFQASTAMAVWEREEELAGIVAAKIETLTGGKSAIILLQSNYAPPPPGRLSRTFLALGAISSLFGSGEDFSRLQFDRELLAALSRRNVPVVDTENSRAAGDELMRQSNGLVDPRNSPALGKQLGARFFIRTALARLAESEDADRQEFAVSIDAVDFELGTRKAENFRQSFLEIRRVERGWGKMVVGGLLTAGSIYGGWTAWNGLDDKANPSDTDKAKLAVAAVGTATGVALFSWGVWGTESVSYEVAASLRDGSLLPVHRLNFRKDLTALFR